MGIILSNAIKKAYTRPSLRLYKPNGEILSILSGNSVKNAYNITKKKTRNDVDIVTFNVAYRTSKQLLNYNSCEMLVKFGKNDMYIIKNVKLSDENKMTIEVTCESYFTVLKGIKCQPLNLIGKSPLELFTAIIASPKNVNLVGKYKWLGTDIVDTYRAVQTQDEASVFENLLTMCQKFEASMEFSTDDTGQKGIYIRKTKINKGKVVKKGKGLKSLDIELDSTEIFTRVTGHGANDIVSGRPISFISINDNKSFVQDVSWYLAQGMTMDQILNTEQCLQEIDFVDNNITSKEELLRLTKEHLAKVSVPRLTGNISMSDFSVREGSSLTEPEINEEIIFIDQDINFNIKCEIESIERKYSENPMDISITISNLIKYDSIIKDLVHNSDTTTKTTSTDDEGNPYVPASVVKLVDENGYHINIPYKFNAVETIIEENEAGIQLRVDNLETETHESIELMEGEIALKVSTSEFGSEIRQHPRDIQVAWNGISNYATLDDTEGLILGDLATGTYSKAGYNGRLELMMKGQTKPYYCLMDAVQIQINCYDGSYHDGTASLPSMFDGIDEDIIKSIVIPKKVWDVENDFSTIPYWHGVYPAEISGGTVYVQAMSAWKDALDPAGETYGGNIIVQVLLMA